MEAAIGQKLNPKLTRIGLSEVIASTWAGLIAAEFEESLALLTVDVGEAEGRIVSGEDYFAIAFTPSPRPELSYLKIAEIRFSAFARADLIARFASASEIPFAVPSAAFPQNPMGYKNRDGWQERSRARRRIL